MARLPLVSPVDRALFLKAQPYLRGLPPNSIAALAQYTEERFFSSGEIVYPAGEPPSHLYFLSSGAVETAYEGFAPYAIEAPGGIGLTEHLAASTIPPSAVATEDTLALGVDVHTFMQIVEDDFFLYLTLARNLNDAISEASERGGIDVGPEPGFPEDLERETFSKLDLVQRLARARRAPFFEGSNLLVLTELLRFQEPRTLEEGELLWQAGDAVESMVLVIDGTFTTFRDGGATLQPSGSMLGGWEIFSHQPRRESARAASDARIIEIDRNLFSDVLEDHFEFAVDYLSKLSRRVIAIRRQATRLDG